MTKNQRDELMATYKERAGKLVQQYYQLPMAKQIILLVVLSATLAFSVAIIFWFQEPTYTPLFSNLASSEAAEVVAALDKNNFDYRVDQNTGLILVPASQARRARLKLAGDGIPGKPDAGFNLLKKDSSFGTSRFMENVRYRHALEYELGKTIAEIKGVKSARVHLAIPKDSSFIIDGKKPSASVMVRLAPGAALSEEQVGAIIQMVATSITGLSPKQVTVADQNGQLLSKSNDVQLLRTKEALNYQKILQNNYEKNILDLLTPLLGVDKVKVRVNVDLDFTQRESATEQFLPSRKNVLSEETLIEKKNMPGAAGVPGTMAINTVNRTFEGSSSKNKAIKNFEVGKEISYIKHATHQVKNITVAVIVDDLTKVNTKTGKIINVPVSKEKLAMITTLTKRAIGFDKNRGDKVSVINSPFAVLTSKTVVTTTHVWEQPWFWDIVKKLIAVLIFFSAVFLILRPVIKSLTEKNSNEEACKKTDESDADAANHAATNNNSETESYASQQASESDLNRNKLHETNQKGWEKVKEISSENPEEVAKILSQWLEKGR